MPQVERNLAIPVSEGALLAADLWLPDQLPAPAIVSYTAYRKDDLAGHAIDAAHRFFADRGYASLLVDLRGLGGSTGRIHGALDAQEAQDGADLVEWAAAQAWCSGPVGIWGLSWGAITALATASVQPAHLRAAVAIMGFLDPAEDWVLPGGCETCMVPVGWATLHLAQQMMPPMFQDAAGGWLEAWTTRLESIRPYLLEWREHRSDEEFWRGLTLDASSIATPTFFIGGWRDMCCAGVVRAYEAHRGPRKLLMGPWGHGYPDQAMYEPLDYLGCVCDWWDHWLRDEGGHQAPGPAVTLFVQGADRWRDEKEWPIDRSQQTRLYLGEAGGMSPSAPARAGSRDYRADPTVGALSGRWDDTGSPGEQSADDARSLTYTTDPLSDNLEVSGSAMATLCLSVLEGKEVHLALRLCDVSPDGHSVLITSGWRKCRPHDAETAQPVEVELWPTSYLVAAGHRLRLSVGCADFPHIWPTETNPLLRIRHGGPSASFLSVPTLAFVEREAAPRVAPAPRVGTALTRSPPSRLVARDLFTDRVTVTTRTTTSLATPSGDGRLDVTSEVEATVTPSRPQDARASGYLTARLRLAGGGAAAILARVWATRTAVFMSARVTLDDVLVSERTWRRAHSLVTRLADGDEQIPRIAAQALQRSEQARGPSASESATLSARDSGRACGPIGPQVSPADQSRG
jgi:putative CocE/NonD family hydrolase